MSLTQVKLGVFFIFIEFEKETKKKTLGWSFFINLCPSSLKKYEIILERTA